MALINSFVMARINLRSMIRLPTVLMDTMNMMTASKAMYR